MSASTARLHQRGPEEMALKKAIVFSLVLHLIALFAMVYSPSPRLDPEQKFKAIDVDLVSQPAPTEAPKSIPKEPSDKPVRPKVAKPVQPPKARPVAPPQAEPLGKPEVGIKRSLKNKTFKPEKAVHNAIDELAKQVKKQPEVDPVKDAIERMRRTVPKEKQQETGGKKEADAPEVTEIGGSSRIQMERVQMYMQQVAMQVRENWAMSEQIAGDGEGLSAKVVFKVMPSGEIEDIWFDERSTNDYFNSSVIKAIHKANPVMPHPPGIQRRFIPIALQFTPSGVE